MREGISIAVSAADRERLTAVVADRNSPQKHVWRARIILATAEGCGTAEIMRRAGVSKPCVWRWQERFMREGVVGLLREKTRKPGLPPLPPALVERVVELTLTEPPGEATHWTGRAMAAATGVSLRSVQRIWAAHRLQPHRVQHFKLSQDPAFATKLRDVVGLYLDPPAHSLVLSVDEKSQIQALDRTQPGLPMKKGRAGTMTHDYIRHGTTTLFAALNVFDGTVIGQCMARHRHQEFIRFLNRIEAVVPAGKLIHAILDNYAVHKHRKVRAWLARHPRWTFHFTPYLLLLGECGRDLLCLAHPPAAATRRLPLAGRPAGGDQPLPRRAQPQTQALCLDSRPRPHHREGQSRVSSDGVKPLVQERD
jgi:transposase